MNTIAIGKIEQPVTAAQVRERRRTLHITVARRVFLALAWALLLFSVGLLALRLAGFQQISTRGDSMEPTFSAGSLLLARLTAPQDIRVGDIITFPGPSEAIPNIIHRVAVLKHDGQRIAAITMGDNNPVPDPEPLTLNRPLARVVLMIPYIGWLFTPVLGWHLLAVGILLGVRGYSSWRTQRGTKTVPTTHTR